MRQHLIDICLSASLLLACSIFADNAMANERFVQKVTIQPGLVVVVAEGDLEARSIGSYSVRVYSDADANKANETTFYTSGLVRARGGVVRSAELLTVAGRKRPLLMVIMESVGSGSYRSADAFAIEPRAVRVVGSVNSLAPSDDPALKLRRKFAGAAR